ncbi:hypothetical protein [Chryseobacterium daeguense]|uniref:hypothetical protein n=1 Tax=Chryseobacterium daeguense TaxID=412438 RepID=UPI00040A25B1|nr:hypothetical protein [Chryseobacterium daeguense]
MKILYFILFTLLISCSKNADDRCFAGKYEQTFKGYVEKETFTVKQILEYKPDYLEISDLRNYWTFKQDSIEAREIYSEEIEEKKWKTHQEEFKLFKEKFSDQFSCSNKLQTGDAIYALGTNNLGFWLLKIEKDRPSAYFLGLSFSHYYINNIQENSIIKDGFLQLEGSLVKIVKVAGLPGYDDYSAIDDGKLFKINLKDLTKDSDNDGYNDIFEKSFGLNPNNKDTDGDGMSDFDDLNPMFISGKNKFTTLYEQLLPAYEETVDLKNLHYTFDIFENDCDYFHQVHPNSRILFTPESNSKKTYYEKVTDLTRGNISKIKRDKLDKNKFYISKSGSSFENDYAAEYKNGKWALEIIGGITI